MVENNRSCSLANHFLFFVCKKQTECSITFFMRVHTLSATAAFVSRHNLSIYTAPNKNIRLSPVLAMKLFQDRMKEMQKICRAKGQASNTNEENQALGNSPFMMSKFQRLFLDMSWKLEFERPLYTLLCYFLMFFKLESFRI